MNHLVNLYKQKKKGGKKKACWEFDRSCSESLYQFRGSHISTKLSLAILGMAYCSIHLAFQFFSAMFSRFQCRAIAYILCFFKTLSYLWGFTYSSVPSGSGFLICCLVFTVICRSVDSVGAPWTLLEVGRCPVSPTFQRV